MMIVSYTQHLCIELYILSHTSDPSALFLGFEMPSYTVQEDAGVLDNFIFVVKEPAGVQTEMDIPVILNLVTGSSAVEGLYSMVQ